MVNGYERTRRVLASQITFLPFTIHYFTIHYFTIHYFTIHRLYGSSSTSQ